MNKTVAQIYKNGHSAKQKMTFRRFWANRLRSPVIQRKKGKCDTSIVARVTATTRIVSATNPPCAEGRVRSGTSTAPAAHTISALNPPCAERRSSDSDISLTHGTHSARNKSTSRRGKEQTAVYQPLLRCTTICSAIYTCTNSCDHGPDGISFELPLVSSECVCPQCNSSFVSTRGSAMTSAMDLAVHLPRANKKHQERQWNSLTNFVQLLYVR